MSGTTSESVNSAIKDRESRKARLLTESRMLQKSQIKSPKVTPEDIQDKLERLISVAKQHSNEVNPVIRALFPNPVKMRPKGKSLEGLSLYSMSGQIVLNQAMAFNFERSSRNEKGEVASALPLSLPTVSSRPCVSKELGFSVHEIGVSVWSAVEPIAIPFEEDVKHFTICKDGTIKPPNTIGKLCIPRREFENKVRELIEVQKHSISHSAKELGASITTVRRVCRTLKIGNYSDTNKGIVSRSSQAPFGWDINQGRLVQNESEWFWIQKMHDLRKQGTSLHKIADFLLTEKVPTKNSGRWLAKTVSQILRREKKT